MLAKSIAGSKPKIKETGMEYCGIDLHAEYSQICILDEDGEVMETSRVQDVAQGAGAFLCPRSDARGDGGWRVVALGVSPSRFSRP